MSSEASHSTQTGRASCVQHSRFSEAALQLSQDRKDWRGPGEGQKKFCMLLCSVELTNVTSEGEVGVVLTAHPADGALKRCSGCSQMGRQCRGRVAEEEEGGRGGRWGGEGAGAKGKGSW